MPRLVQSLSSQNFIPDSRVSLNCGEQDTYKIRLETKISLIPVITGILQGHKNLTLVIRCVIAIPLKASGFAVFTGTLLLASGSFNAAW